MTTRLVKVLHRDERGGLILAFEWQTKKGGTIGDVLGYLYEKFTIDYPKGFSGRPLKRGDRIEITNLDGPFAGRVSIFEVVTEAQFREV